VSVSASGPGWRCECVGECGRGTHDGRCPNVHRGAAYGTGSLVILTVAHLDHTPEHCDDSNLRHMCQGCHLHYDREHPRADCEAESARVQSRITTGEITMVKLKTVIGQIKRAEQILRDDFGISDTTHEGER
jgi:hypothetical protein